MGVGVGLIAVVVALVMLGTGAVIGAVTGMAIRVLIVVVPG